MRDFRLLIIGAFILFGIVACFESKPKRYIIAESKSYEASLFRQHCAICHGPEANGQILDNGTRVPSLREGEFKFKTEGEICKHVTEGGNGMTPFRSQFTEREIRLMVDFVINDLRGHNK